jgi:photosystem II stability/assembly factor-like uncharacterized protein
MKSISIRSVVLGPLLTLGCTDSGVVSPAPPEYAWTQVRMSQNDGYYHALCFADENTGWAVGDSGKILNTTDSGRTWHYQLQKGDALFVDICFVNPSHGWAITFAGTIYRYQAS